MNVVESDALGSKTEVAVTVTEGFGGTVGGALYWTEFVVGSVSVPAPSWSKLLRGSYEGGARPLWRLIRCWSRQSLNGVSQPSCFLTPDSERFGNDAAATPHLLKFFPIRHEFFQGKILLRANLLRRRLTRQRFFATL